MLRSVLTGLAGASLALAYGPTLVLNPLSINKTGDSYSLAFTYTNTGTGYFNGGPDTNNCSLSWNASTTNPHQGFPSCFTPCSQGNEATYFRIVPGSFHSIKNFTVNVAEIYDLEHINKVQAKFTIAPYSDPSVGYSCTKLSSTMENCSVSPTGQGFMVTTGDYGDGNIHHPVC